MVDVLQYRVKWRLDTIDTCCHFCHWYWLHRTPGWGVCNFGVVVELLESIYSTGGITNSRFSLRPEYRALDVLLHDRAVPGSVRDCSPLNILYLEVM